MYIERERERERWQSSTSNCGLSIYVRGVLKILINVETIVSDRWIRYEGDFVRWDRSWFNRRRLGYVRNCRITIAGWAKFETRLRGCCYFRELVSRPNNIPFDALNVSNVRSIHTWPLIFQKPSSSKNESPVGSKRIPVNQDSIRGIDLVYSGLLIILV